MLQCQKGSTLAQETCDAGRVDNRTTPRSKRHQAMFHCGSEMRLFSTEENNLTKFNPLAQWTSADIWHYIQGKIESPTTRYTTEATFLLAASLAHAR